MVYRHCRKILQDPSKGVSRSDEQVLGRQYFVYDMDDSISGDDIAGYDLSLVIYIHGILRDGDDNRLSLEGSDIWGQFQVFQKQLVAGDHVVTKNLGHEALLVPGSQPQVLVKGCR